MINCFIVIYTSVVHSDSCLSCDVASVLLMITGDRDSARMAIFIAYIRKVIAIPCKYVQWCQVQYELY